MTAKTEYVVWFVWMQEYHAIAEQLQLVPITAKRSQGVRFEARLHRTSSSTAEVVDIDFKVCLDSCSTLS
jgi:hypothetical protein